MEANWSTNDGRVSGFWYPEPWPHKHRGGRFGRRTQCNANKQQCGSGQSKSLIQLTTHSSLDDFSWPWSCFSNQLGQQQWQHDGKQPNNPEHSTEYTPVISRSNTSVRHFYSIAEFSRKTTSFSQPAYKNALSGKELYGTSFSLEFTLESRIPKIFSFKTSWKSGLQFFSFSVGCLWHATV